MRVLLLIEENSIANALLKALDEADVSVFRSRDPMRMVDCIADLAPDILVVRQKDFPLHAQLFAAMVRFYKPLQRCKVIIVGEGEPSFPGCSFIGEASLSEKSSAICSTLLGPNYAGPHRGSRLVARAQRMMKE